MKILLTLSGLFLCLTACNKTDQIVQEELSRETATYLEPGIMCGTVQFEDGCSPQLDSVIRFGLALVHHMTYEDAAYNFDKVIKQDPDCFWGYWGKALTYIHPLWPDQPTNDQLKSGISLSSKALSLAKNEKEKLYASALVSYYKDAMMYSERDRLLNYEKGWKNVSETFPDDLEARLFHGLARLSVAPQGDPAFNVQKEVGRMAEAVLEVIPDHPGGFHYAIHAYDHPPLAGEALRVARNYSSIAPEIPHALHMPTHIFTRLGYWDDSIEGNRKSADAAKKMPVEGTVSLHYLHALDYMVYAYLQQARTGPATDIMDEIKNLEPPFQDNGAAAYALAAIPARIALENRDWNSASSHELLFINEFPWHNHPAYRAIHYFARGVGAARSGNTALADNMHGKLDSIHLAMMENKQSAYWTEQVEIQKRTLEGLVAYANGNTEKGIQILAGAVDKEAMTSKSPVTPGELMPAREILADLYLMQGDFATALEHYEKSLERNPNRFNTLWGAASAAEKMKDKVRAKNYYRQLLKLSEKADTNRPEISVARKYMDDSTKNSRI